MVCTLYYIREFSVLLLFIFFLHLSAYDAHVAGLYYAVNNTGYGFQVLIFNFLVIS